MNESILTTLSGLLGVIVGAVLQYFLQVRTTRNQIDIENRSNLYAELFNELRNLGNDQIIIGNLICKAQIYASDEVLDILNKISLKDGFNKKILHTLLTTIRKELRPNSKARNLHVFTYKKVKKPW